MRRIAASVAWVGLTASAGVAFGAGRAAAVDASFDGAGRRTVDSQAAVGARAAGRLLADAGAGTGSGRARNHDAKVHPRRRDRSRDGAVKQADALDLPPLVDPVQPSTRRNAAKPAFADPAPLAGLARRDGRR